MQQLVAAGKQIILLSNSSKRKSGSLVRLAEMGFAVDTYLDVVTSGELAHEGLAAPRATAPYNEIQGTKVLVFGSGDEDREYVTELGCQVANVDTADFLLARGPFTILDSPDATAAVQRFGPGRILHESPEFDALVTKAVARYVSLCSPVGWGCGGSVSPRVLLFMSPTPRIPPTHPPPPTKKTPRNLPMIVSNPDVVRPGGDNDPMPGLIGQAYERKGGRVVYVGKPYPLVYQRCRELLGPGHATLRVCAIGDSMWNDIKGAVNEGWASVLVTDGIHAEALGVVEGSGESVGEAAHAAFWKGFAYRPTHTVPRFRW